MSESHRGTPGTGTVNWESVKAGKMAATVAQDPYAMGVTAVQTLLKLIKGEKVEFDMLVPSKLITK